MDKGSILRNADLDIGFDNVIIPLAVLDKEFKYINVNKAFANAFKRDKEHILGHSHFEFFSDESKHALFSEAVRTKKSHQSFAEPLNVPNRPGVSYWDTIINPIVNESGEVENVVLSLKDVTKQKIAEANIRKSEEDYRLLFELNVVGIVRRIYNPETDTYVFLNCNDAYKRILGYSPQDEMTYPSIEEVVHNKRDWNKYMKSLLRDKKVFNYRVRIKQKNGRSIWILINSSAREYKEKGKMLIEGIIIDITEQKRTEEKLLSAQKKLRALASEILISDERLRQNFAAILHDSVVQTLGVAKLHSHFLEQYISHGGIEYLTELQSMISQSITQSRTIMSQLSPPVLNELGLFPALESLAEQIKSQYKIPIKVELSKKCPPVTREIEVFLFQATQELLTNIVKHAMATESKIRISARGKNVQIEVIDNGRGFDRNKMYNTDSSGGYGLFSIRERLIHLGGCLRIQSRSDKGSRVVVSCPTGGGNYTFEGQQENTPE